MTALCNTSNLKSSIASDIFVEMLFILDIIFNFRMTFVNEKGEVVEAGKEIALHYIKGEFQTKVSNSILRLVPPGFDCSSTF